VLRLIAAGVVALIALVGYCGQKETNPITGEEQHVALDADQEIALGLQAAPQLAREYGGPEPDPEARALVDRVGDRVVQASAAGETPYRYAFHVLDDGETLNAFALPGGQVFITDGLLDRLGSEAELAGVLAHEVGHVVARHGAQHLAKQQLAQGLAGATVIATYDPQSPGTAATGAIAAAIGQLVNMRFSREDELEADALGVRFMAEADYDPAAMLTVLEVLSESSSGMPEFFSTHPNPEDRVARLRELIEAHR
jgi:predicted Zn-dependent protease